MEKNVLHILSTIPESGQQFHKKIELFSLKFSLSRQNAEKSVTLHLDQYW